jgi:hypothetical protein
MASRKMYRPDKPLGENFERLLYGLMIVIGVVALVKGCG